MQVITKSLGIMAANCYMLRNEEEAVIIDPGGNPELLYPEIGRRRLRYIIDTHGHYDHIGANNDLKARYDTMLVVGRYDYEMLLNPGLNLSIMVDSPYISVPPDKLLEDGDSLPFDRTSLEVLYTPGHTKGSICVKVGNMLFAGDTLFYHSVGRTDLPTGSADELRKSITERLYVLPDETKVYSGHGEATTIGEEKRHNDFVRA
jgi:glyoxylase-like metal-dependent hydrolase (beta-lactamase superfamily II)